MRIERSSTPAEGSGGCNYRRGNGDHAKTSYDSKFGIY